MMACCPLCGKLCATVQGEQKWGTRERVYRVIAHSRPVHEGCGVEVHYEHNGELIDKNAAYKCLRCGVVSEDAITSGPPCFGPKQAIR